jgi:hypothetical protein
MVSFRPLMAAIVAVWLAIPAAAHAQTPPDDAGEPAPRPPSGDDEKPWAKGVSPDDQKAANDLFKEGNALVRDSFFVQAVEKYQEAVAHWDHPAIHYNLAIALINLDRPLELYDSLQKALAYGTAALDEEKIELAERYRKLVEQQLIWIDVSCTESGAKVYVDGKELFTGPGHQEQLLRAGEHTFSATKSGFETAAVTRIFPGADHEKVALKLYRPEDLTGYKRKFSPWLPWAVTGAGVVVAGIGGILHASAASDFADFDAWAKQCENETHMACPVTSEKQSLRDGANTKQTMAVIGYSVGAAAVVTGLTLVLINRPHPYRLDAEDLDGHDGVSVVPLVTPGGGGISASLHF